MRRGICRAGFGGPGRGRIRIERSSEIVKASLLRLLRGGRPPRTRRAQSTRARSSRLVPGRGILEHAVGEALIKCITVRHLITLCIQGSYTNAPFGFEILV